MQIVSMMDLDNLKIIQTLLCLIFKNQIEFEIIKVSTSVSFV